MKRSLAAITLTILSSSAFAFPVNLNVDKNATVYVCKEIQTVFEGDVPNGLQDNGTVNILDYGNSFFAVSPTQNAVSYSDVLTQKTPNGYLAGQPVKGITMAKGIDKDTIGTYMYVGAQALISWDCRK